MKHIYSTVIIVIVTIIAVISVNNLGDIKVKVNDGVLKASLNKVGKDHKTVVIMIAGSGPTDRNGNSSLIKGRNDSLLQLAKALNKQGIDTFRYDKRSAGKSFKSFKDIQNTDFDDFVNDAIACINLLKNKGYNNIYVAGHSQGSLIAMLSTKSGHVNGVISIAGPAHNVYYGLKEQLAANNQYESVKYILEELKQGRIVKNVKEENKLSFSIANQKFLISWMKYNPLRIAKDLKVPIIFLNGDMDSQVPIANLETFQRALPQSKCITLKNTNHVLKVVTNEKQNVESYSKAYYKLNETLVKEITSFVK